MRWYAVINDYAKRNLTVETDKLPALSGVAQKFQAKLQNDYVAGLFASDLHRGLLWNPGRNLENNSQYPGPSWSWISPKGPTEVCDHAYRARPAGS